MQMFINIKLIFYQKIKRILPLRYIDVLFFMFDFDFSISAILFYSLLLTVLIEIIYYLGIFSKLAFYKDKTVEPNHKQPVSIIICARNEEFNKHHSRRDYPK